MEQMTFWDISWTDVDFEDKTVKAKIQIDKFRKVLYSQEKWVNDIDAMLEEIISCRADREKAGNY